MKIKAIIIKPGKLDSNDIMLNNNKIIECLETGG